MNTRRKEITLYTKLLYIEKQKNLNKMLQFD